MKPKPPYSRTRERFPSPRIFGPRRQYIFNVVTGVYDSDITTSVDIWKNVDRMQDIVSPGYAQRVSTGDRLNNPLTLTRAIVTGGHSAPITGTYAPGTSGHRTGYMDESFRSLGCCTGVVYPVQLPKELNAMVGRVQTEALAGVEAPELESIAALGELRQTLDLMVSPLRGLNKWLTKAERTYERDLARYGRAQARANRARSAKERARRRAQIAKRGTQQQKAVMDRMRSFGESLADGVLGVNLGWTPFIMDLDSLLCKIPSLESKIGDFMTSRAQKSLGTEWTEQRVRTASWIGQATTETKAREELLVRASVRYRASFKVNQHFGLRLQDLPSGVWNLVPFSWLVDYVINVNDYLNALRALAYVELFDFSTSTQLKCDARNTCIGFVPGTSNGHTWIISGGPVGASESSVYMSKLRWPEPFGASLVSQGSVLEQAPSHLQNILGITLSRLLGIRKNLS